MTAAKNSVGAKLALIYWYGEQQRFTEASDLLAEINRLTAYAAPKFRAFTIDYS